MNGSLIKSKSGNYKPSILQFFPSDGKDQNHKNHYFYCIKKLMTRYPFKSVAELWTSRGYESPILAYHDIFKNELEQDIEELQERYEKERRRIDHEMDFMNINPEQMTTEEKRI